LNTSLTAWLILVYAVQQIADQYAQQGYIVSSTSPVAVSIDRFSAPRVYDLLVEDPNAPGGPIYIGVEVKTTLFSTIFLNPMQVAKDVALLTLAAADPLFGGGYAQSLNLQVTCVAYQAVCFGCSAVNIRSNILFGVLNAAGVSVSTGVAPGVYSK